jgi:hypothetical protein
MRRPRLRAPLVLVAVGVVVGLAGGTTYAAFFATTSNPGNSFTALADWTPPSAGGSVIMRSGGSIPGYIRQGRTYFVYANVTDGGNPPSGVTSVTANLTNITVGQTAVPLTSAPCPCVVAGLTYNYRSASLTASNPLAEGAKTYTLTMTDGGGNSATQSGFVVTVDNTAPGGSDIQTANKVFVVGHAETGDTITYTFSETMDPSSIMAGWDGSATSVTLRLTNNAGGDRVTVFNGTTQLSLGTVNLGRTDYTTGTVNFTGSTMVQSGTVITITLGIPDQPSRLRTAGGNGTMTWTPSSAALDAAGNACSTTTRTESGAADPEF